MPWLLFSLISFSWITCMCNWLFSCIILSFSFFRGSCYNINKWLVDCLNKSEVYWIEIISFLCIVLLMVTYILCFRSYLALKLFVHLFQFIECLRGFQIVIQKFLRKCRWFKCYKHTMLISQYTYLCAIMIGTFAHRVNGWLVTYIMVNCTWERLTSFLAADIASLLARPLRCFAF